MFLAGSSAPSPLYPVYQAGVGLLAYRDHRGLRHLRTCRARGVARCRATVRSHQAQTCAHRGDDYSGGNDVPVRARGWAHESPRCACHSRPFRWRSCRCGGRRPARHRQEPRDDCERSDCSAGHSNRRPARRADHSVSAGADASRVLRARCRVHPPGCWRAVHERDARAASRRPRLAEAATQCASERARAAADGTARAHLDMGRGRLLRRTGSFDRSQRVWLHLIAAGWSHALRARRKRRTRRHALCALRVPVPS